MACPAIECVAPHVSCAFGQCILVADDAACGGPDGGFDTGTIDGGQPDGSQPDGGEPDAADGGQPDSGNETGVIHFM